MASKDFIGYPKLMDRALRGLVKEILQQTAKQGLMGAHHFFITFDTRAQGVLISDYLRERYPDDMTIVLQHKYWGLKIEERHFEVTLTFNKIPEEIVVPFHAIRRFSDPSQDFGFALQAIAPDAGFVPAAKPAAEPQSPAPQPAAKAETPAEEPKPPSPTVVSLDAFRKK
jgi:hypothetical protein